MKRVLVMDLAADGHHPRYVRWILECGECRAAEVVLAGRSELFSHPELRDVADGIQCHPVNLSAKQESILSNTVSIAALARRQFAVWKIWQQTYDEVSRTIPVDVVIIPSADDCLDAIAMRGSPFQTTPWMGIAIKPRFHFNRVGVVAPLQRFSAAREWLFRRALHDRCLVGVFSIDPTLDEYADSLLKKKERQKLVYLPDPAIDHVLPSKATARESLGIRPNAKVVLAYGMLSGRKGIRSLIECARSSQCPSNICVVLAGQQTPEIAALLMEEASSFLRKENRLKVFNGYVSDADEARLLAATDWMWVGYREFYMMSGVLVLAARHGIPCLVSDSGVAGYLVKKHQCGLAVNADDRAEVLGALQEISRDTGMLKDKGARAMAAFIRSSIAEFQRVISTVVEIASSVGTEGLS